MILFNGTFSNWYKAVINAMSENYNDFLGALKVMYFVLIDWLMCPVRYLKDGYRWFGTRWQHEDSDVQMALLLVTCIFCIPAVIMIVQCIFFPGKFRWSGGDRFHRHLSQEKILHLHEMAKTAFKQGHTEMVLDYTDEYTLDVNAPAPQTGLTLFLCACLSGHRKLVCEMLKRGGDVNVVTSDEDSALYLAAFGVLNSLKPDLTLLQDLLNAGCSVNCQNSKGFTPLHRAATRGNVPVINWLLQHGADRYLTNRFGVYPVNSATNAGHQEVTPLLSVSTSGRVVDVQLHTPVRAAQDLQNPQQQHITESLKQLRCVKRKIHKLLTP